MQVQVDKGNKYNTNGTWLTVNSLAYYTKGVLDPQCSGYAPNGLALHLTGWWAACYLYFDRGPARGTDDR